MRSKDRNHRIGGANWHNKLRSSKQFFLLEWSKIETRGKQWFSMNKLMRMKTKRHLPCLSMFHTILYYFICTCCSLCSSCFHLVWHGFHDFHNVFILFVILCHHCSSCVMVFDMVFIMCLRVLIAFFTCMVFIILLHVLAVFQPKMSRLYTFVLKKHQHQDKQETAFTFTRILKHAPLLGINLFFRLLTKGSAKFPHSNNCLDSERNCLSCARWCKDTPYKDGKNTPQKAPFGWEWLPACLHFFGTNMSCEMKKKAASKSRQLARYGPGQFQAIHPKIASPH